MHGGLASINKTRQVEPGAQWPSPSQCLASPISHSLPHLGISWPIYTFSLKSPWSRLWSCTAHQKSISTGIIKEHMAHFVYQSPKNRTTVVNRELLHPVTKERISGHTSSVFSTESWSTRAQKSLQLLPIQPLSSPHHLMLLYLTLQKRGETNEGSAFSLIHPNSEAMQNQIWGLPASE